MPPADQRPAHRSPLRAGWVIFSLRGPLKESYQADLDVTNPLLVAAPCLLMAIIAHPSTRHFILFRVREWGGRI